MASLPRGFNDAPSPRVHRPKNAKSEANAAYGMPRLMIPAEAPGKCTTPRCGAKADTLDEDDPALSGWTRVGVYGSREPDRVWCSGLCAVYGVALAELRLTATARSKADAARKAREATDA
ncbi:hypothetical protein OG582_11775 [Streptomyces anulatus]|uniref:hypothetical protein n=1 Tax=Streptomyces anulatus TaxID=1892 RepID=UPI00324B3F14